MRDFRHGAVVFGRDKIRQRSAEVIQEGIALRASADQVAGQRR
jgi:hypothetical protein